MAIEVDASEPGSTLVPAQSRDDVFWTELEIRRLGNMVAESVQSRRYIGDSDEAHKERLLMRKRIEAMRRKALRVLFRAESYSTSGERSWPGLDRNLTEPVSLAEEYVRVVTNYDAALAEEEEEERERANRARRQEEEDIDVGGVRAHSRAAAAAALGSSAPNTDVCDPDGETPTPLAPCGLLADAEHEDISYREALAREGLLLPETAAAETDDERATLLQIGQGMRQRRSDAVKRSAAAAEEQEQELMERHQPVEDQLTAEIVRLAGQWKENLTDIHGRIVKDNAVIDDTEDTLEQNLAGIKHQRDTLSAYTRRRSSAWWWAWIALAVVVIVFVVLVVLMRVPL